MTRPNTPEDHTHAVSKKEVQALQGREAITEYRAEQQATLDKTARLRALRLAQGKEQTDTADLAAKSGSPKEGTSRRARLGLHQGLRGQA
jgi:hypothetical protein